jgi:lysozyme
LIKRFALALGAAFLLLTFLVVAYFEGLWIPNRPNPVQYPVRGVDVSAHQGRVNWNSVASSGIRFVYLKATEGGDFQDEMFGENLRGAHQAGLECGAYHFFSLKTPGALQAQNFIKAVPKDFVSLPPAVDLEYWGNSSARPSVENFQEQLGFFLDAIRKEYDREPVLYTSHDFSSVYLVNFSIKRPWVRAIIFGPGRDGDNPWLFWQFTERAMVPGIRGFVDMDVFNGSQAEFALLSKS